MGNVSIIILAVIVVAIIWAVIMYNNLVSLKHAVAKAWANIDVLLKQRHDELPKLVMGMGHVTWASRRNMRDAGCRQRSVRAKPPSPISWVNLDYTGAARVPTTRVCRDDFRGRTCREPL